MFEPDDVFSLSEKKWTLLPCLRTGASILMGVAQIAIGVLIEVYSAGFGTYVGSALITEGCSDLIFAMECAISGHCSWESYFQHKLFSIKFTTLTAGIGMVLSRGAKYSKFGYNFGRSHLKHLCGKELIKQVGLRHVAIAAAKRIVQKTIGSAALGLANGVIDNYVNQKLGDFYRKLSGSIISANEENIRSSDLKEKIKALSQKVGATKAREILSQLMSECLHGGAMSRIMEAIGQVGRALSTGFGLAVKKMGKCGRTTNAVIAKLASWLPKILNLSNLIATINKIYSTAVSVTKSLISKVEEKINQTDSVNKVEDTPEDEAQLYDDMMNNWTKQMTAKFETVLSEEIGKPLLKQGAQKLIFYVGTQLKNQYTKYQNQQRRAEFEALKSEYVNAKENIPYEIDKSEPGLKLDKSYHKALSDLLERTKDPLLFADIIRAGVPLGIHSVQAIAELSGRPIVINVCGDVDKITMPPEFTPCCRVSNNKNPICIYYIPGDGDLCGQFFSPQSDDQMAFSGGNDCLLDAVSNQLDAPLDREQLACEIEVNPEIRAGIEQGIHKYLNSTGGALKDTQRSLMDRPVKEKGAMHGTGNHEILRKSELEKWMERSKDQPPGHDMEGNPYDHSDLVIYFRVDIRFVIWKGKNGTLQGQDGALYNEENGKRVEGRNLFHLTGYAAIMNTESAGQAVGVALSIHITRIIGPWELKRMTRIKLKNTVTATGHYLAISRQKKHFCKGYEREYYKIYLVAKKFNAPNLPSYNPPGWLTKDSQMNVIKTEIDNARSIKDFGNVLMKPAPFG